MKRRRRGRRRRWPWVVAGVLALLMGAGWLIYGGGRHEGPGKVTPARVPPTALRDHAVAQSKTRIRLGEAGKQILFGDLHVHSTFSADAFMRSLPLAGGEGAHPPADACDFARFCSALDFFALTDHAEALTPRHWRETKESIRQCNAAAGDPRHPDLVAYVGFEWTQVGATPAEHYGHKNVIFRELTDNRLPARPISAPGLGSAFRNTNSLGGSLWNQLLIPILEFSRRQRYLNFRAFIKENAAVASCPRGVDTRKLPPDCRESADTPQELFEKLGQWGFDSLVIPHGTTWGFYTPPGYSYDKQLTRAQHDAERQRLIEVYSGHGNSEEYRPWRAVRGDPNRAPICPEPSPGFEPCCWRAGEIIRSRCGNIPAAECEARVRKARDDYVSIGVAGHLTVPGVTVEDWKDCDQCRDCFNPSFNFRPGGSVQYIAARRVFPKGGGKPIRPVWGFIASSDNHSARPGTGYKELARLKMTEAAGVRSAAWRERFFGPPQKPSALSVRLTRAEVTKRPAIRMVHVERQASFFMTGGLVAAHSAGRSRDAIWSALRRREVYGTSGSRILLWFHLSQGGKRHPMGSDVELGAVPRFLVRAAGAFKQRPGCPDWSRQALGAERLAKICAGECYHPSDERLRITRIEVVRIRPQRTPGEPLAQLIEDPWRRIPCPPDRSGCSVEFSDPDFPKIGRDTLYYVRAVQEPTPAVNAGGVRCERDADGGCRKARPCYGDYRTPRSDDCLSPNEERAWSSPIYLRWLVPKPRQPRP